MQSLVFAIVRIAAAYVSIVAAALVALAVYGSLDAGAVTLTIVAATMATVAVTGLLLSHMLRDAQHARAVARAMAEGRFEAEVAATRGTDGDLAATLARAMSTAARTVSVLHEERAQMEALLNAGSDATVAVDRAGCVVYMNEGARGLLEGSVDDAIGRPFIETVRDHDMNEMLMSAAQHGERSVRIVPYGRLQRWLQVTAVPVAGAGAWAAVALFHDLTEVRRLDNVRRDFITNVSHELRTPLAGIRAAVETLQEGAIDDPPAAQEFLGHIQRETDRMTQMTEELLELSRIESGAAPLQFDQADVASIVDETARRFAQQAERAGVVLGIASVERPLYVTADADRLERALGNLVANALKFTPAGGRVSIAALRDGGDAVISVEDTGTGIEPAEQARVFERFYKADRGRSGGGMGLGLAIVKHVVEAHHGSVTLESRPGRGSTFSMRLPLR